MPVLTRARIREITETLPEAEYPEEVMRRWHREYLVAKAQMASGERKAQTVEEIAAEYGIDLDEEL
jgi:hypothetical protein